MSLIDDLAKEVQVVCCAKTINHLIQTKTAHNPTFSSHEARAS